MHHSNFTRDQLIIEAETLEECGEYLHVELMGYSPEELRAAAMIAHSPHYAIPQNLNGSCQKGTIMINDPLVQKEQQILQEVAPELSISGVGSSNDKITEVRVGFPLKGNKELILKLRRIGWYCAYRSKRNGSFYQIMRKDFHYQKYAIYRTEFGLHAKMYFDNIYAVRHAGLHYIKVDSLPVTVNRKGGYTSFEMEYDLKDGFVEIIELLEGEEPLTREQMYPKNSDKFKYGWIDRAGNTYTCGFEGHYYCAEAICKEQGIDSYNPESELEKQGYVRISRPAPYTYENMDQTYPYFCTYASNVGEYITKKQYEKLCELGFGEDPHVNLWCRWDT